MVRPLALPPNAGKLVLGSLENVPRWTRDDIAWYGSFNVNAHICSFYDLYHNAL